jgi:hypothetical protein
MKNTYSIIATENLLRFVLFYFFSIKIIVDYSGLTYHCTYKLVWGEGYIQLHTLLIALSVVQR